MECWSGQSCRHLFLGLCRALLQMDKQKLRGVTARQAHSKPSPRHRHFLPQGGHRTAACPSAKTGLVSADHTPGVSVPWIYTVVWCNVKRTLPHAMGQQCSNLVKAWMVSKLKETHHCHFISLVPGISNNSSSHSVLTSTLGGWHTSQLVFRRKDYAVWSSEQGLIWQELNWVLLSLESSVLVSSP